MGVMRPEYFSIPNRNGHLFLVDLLIKLLLFHGQISVKLSMILTWLKQMSLLLDAL